MCINLCRMVHLLQVPQHGCNDRGFWSFRLLSWLSSSTAAPESKMTSYPALMVHVAMPTRTTRHGWSCSEVTIDSIGPRSGMTLLKLVPIHTLNLQLQCNSSVVTVQATDW